MKVIARSLVVIFVALIAVPALAVSVTITTAVQLLAAVTGVVSWAAPSIRCPSHRIRIEFINEYMDLADNNYIKPGTGQTPTNRVAVIYPAEFFPVFGSTTFDDSVDAGRDNLNSCIRGQACNGGDVVPRTKGVGRRGPLSLSSVTRRVPWSHRSSKRISSRTPRARRTTPDSCWTRIRCGPTAASSAAGSRV